MAITPLPQSTIHLLGSSQALTTSLSLVKELIDNALDAKATHVDILIAQNTLDKVEVRDNGHGIPPEDYDALGRRGHTSKLRSFDELKSVGGVTLGFRGEALASAVQLGEVTINTKTEGEQVGNCVMLKAPGGVLKQSRISHPVGTTVCVKNFISRIPVRKQVALKAAPKMLVKMKELLHSYALARPTIRFSLKIIKESKGSWSFVPRPSEGIRGAATQVIGKDAALECVEKSLAFPEHKSFSSLMKTSDHALSSGDGSDLHAKANEFVVEMFLPKPDADLAKLGHGQYISIDSRPVANDKGTMKKIVTLFKTYIKGSHRDITDTIKNPFLRMNIVCPVASYDPNVEPAKDDVLFVNEDWVIESIESFFKKFYGEHEKSTGSRSREASTTPVDDFNLLLARNHPTLVNDESEAEKAPASLKEPSTQPRVAGQERALAIRKTINLTDEDENSDLAEDEEPPLRRKTLQRKGIDMFDDLSEDVEDLRHPPQSRKDGVSNHQQMKAKDNGSSGLDPWVIAKMTAPVRPRVELVSTLPEIHESPQTYVTPYLLTPHRSSDPLVPDVHHRSTGARGPRQRKVSNPFQLTPAASRDVPEFQVESPVPQRQAHASRAHAVPLENSQESSLLLVGDDATEFARRNDFISARNVTEEHIARPTIPTSVKLPMPKNGKANPNKPFLSPLASMQTHSGDNLRQTTLYKPPLAMERSVEPEENTDLEWSMDYENRKEEFTRQQRSKTKVARAKVAKLASEEAEANVEEDVVRASPHKNRYQAALATLSHKEVQPEALHNVAKRPAKSLIPDGDPRAYLIRRQRSMSIQAAGTSKMTRLRSTRLPLERVPETEEMHALMLTVPTNIDIIQKLAHRVGEEDAYIRDGSIGHGLIMGVAETPEFMRRIKDIAMKWKETKTDGDLEFEYSFGNLGQARIEMLR